MKRIEGVTERLLAAAREEFLEKGYEAASLRAIAERAGSSKGPSTCATPTRRRCMRPWSTR